MKNKKTKKDRQAEHNKEILEALKNKTELPKKMDTIDSWFPPRPLIKKDKEAMKKLYKKENVDDV